MPDIMEQLLSIEPLPRGERLARWYEQHPKYDLRAWLRDGWCPWRLIHQSYYLSVLEYSLEVFADANKKAEFWRNYAAPLRRCRDKARKREKP